MNNSWLCKAHCVAGSGNLVFTDFPTSIYMVVISPGQSEVVLPTLQGASEMRVVAVEPFKRVVKISDWIIVP